MIDFTLDSYQLDRLRVNQQAQATSQQQRKTQNSVISNTNDIMARDMSAATREILFASNTLFWVGVACLEAPHHMIRQIEDGQASAVPDSPYLGQLQQIQYFGMAAVRRTLEETSFVKILIVFEKLSDLFFSYNLQMECKKQSFMNILFNSIGNPLCTRDALKTLILSIRIQDTRLLVGQMQPNLDILQGEETSIPDLREDPTAEELNLKQAVGKVELVRLLYLLPYFMQQFLAPPEGAQQNLQQDQLFQNKKNMIQLLKKSLPSIGINKKSAIFERLEVIQRRTANQHFERLDEASQNQEYLELSHEFQSLIKETVDLIYQQGFKGSLMECSATFKRLAQYQLQKYGPAAKGGEEAGAAKKASAPNDQPIQIGILQQINSYLEEVFAPDDQAALAKANDEKKVGSSIFNQCSEILGEEADNYRPEFRALYFGLKNIILREIEYSDRDTEVSQFFDQEAAPNPPPRQKNSLGVAKMKGAVLRKSGTGGAGQGAQLNAAQRFNPIMRQSTQA